MYTTTTKLYQHEIPEAPQSAVVLQYSLDRVAEWGADFRASIPSDPPFSVGVSIGLAPAEPRIQTLALATQDKVFCLSLRQSPSPTQCKALQELFSDIPYLAGFEFSYTIVLLAHTLGSNVTGYDLSTLAMVSKHRDLTTPGSFLKSKNSSVFTRRVNDRWDGDVLRSGPNSSGIPRPNHALRAWFTAIAANMAFSDLLSAQKLSTESIDMPMLRVFVDLASRATRLDLLKPRIQEAEFSKVQTVRDGSISLENARYKTRVRASAQTRLEICLENGDVVNARVNRAEGRTSSARAGGPLKGEVSRIRVIGREERTNAEQAQYRFLLHSLTAMRHIPPFINIIWFPGNAQEIESDEEIDLSCGLSSQVLRILNDSQQEVVRAMVSTAPQDLLVVAHGPPGTGKTTTIAAAASMWESHKRPCWIIAQSNVGVKNIAEKLFKVGVSFRLLVSQEFLFQWHEGLYVEIEDMVIRSDELPNSQKAVSRLFGDATVVLCTLATLSNPKLNDCGLFRVIPVRSLVIDEASQIDVFEFMHLFYKFSSVLKKVCFFGDPKQLPPYCAGEADLKTIFDVKHLKRTAYFLNIQYRLPTRLGEFISENVYTGKLRSCHKIMDYSCVAFIDVSKGEETKQGNSFENLEEVHMVVRIAQRYNQLGLNFCVITFYDPQRAAISKAIEAANLPTGCVYNVDSFQGNEADYVILSSVRTQHAGFLNSRPRMNVALTRCRKGMVVVTNKCFLSGAGRNTLLGKLCYAWSQRRDAWIDRKAMLNDSVALPGLPVWSYGTPSPAAPVFTPASASQRLLVYTQTHEQMGPGLHTATVTPRLDAPPLPRTTTTATTYNMFPSLSSMAQSRPTEARQPVQLGASQFPEQLLQLQHQQPLQKQRPSQQKQKQKQQPSQQKQKQKQQQKQQQKKKKQK